MLELWIKTFEFIRRNPLVIVYYCILLATLAVLRLKLHDMKIDYMILILIGVVDYLIMYILFIELSFKVFNYFNIEKKHIGEIIAEKKNLILVVFLFILALSLIPRFIPKQYEKVKVFIHFFNSYILYVTFFYEKLGIKAYARSVKMAVFNSLKIFKCIIILSIPIAGVLYFLSIIQEKDFALNFIIDYITPLVSSIYLSIAIVIYALIYFNSERHILGKSPDQIDDTDVISE